MYLFVYGTLRKGDPNHAHLKDSHFLCSTQTAGKYVMIDLGAFPGVLKHEDISQMPVSAIMGEVYDISEETLEKLDRYEGEWYYREEIRLENGLAALMYFLKKIPLPNYKTVTDGNWIRKER
ncbi:gamma-glutamylcyclotransferase family protein [uncultured Methanolobus sp.]|uniref:gamma-glutamylcyclotransferase family protein n=1 Tax=uncultured Methanolobus sp. TaxID=218300 RepID=UPI002AAB5BA2|nr:gamma-glutamylcyclotransferase family protein [uncultured Methanolobus sp.]